MQFGGLAVHYYISFSFINLVAALAPPDSGSCSLQARNLAQMTRARANRRTLILGEASALP